MSDTTVFRVRVRGTWLAMDPSCIETVIEAQPATRLPGAPSFLLGLLHVGASALPVIDLGELLAIHAAAERDDERPPRIVVARSGRLRAGLLCERALGVEHLGETSWRPLGLIAGEVLVKYLDGEMDQKDGVIGFLNLPRLLEDARVKGEQAA